MHKAALNDYPSSLATFCDQPTHYFFCGCSFVLLNYLAIHAILCDSKHPASLPHVSSEARYSARPQHFLLVNCDISSPFPVCRFRSVLLSSCPVSSSVHQFLGMFVILPVGPSWLPVSLLVPVSVHQSHYFCPSVDRPFCPLVRMSI